MKLKKIVKVNKGKYLNKYELTYENNLGKMKVYEMVSRNNIISEKDIGSRVSAVVIIAFCKGRLLLLKEFRMALNSRVYNFVSGLIEKGETVEDAVKRELREETGMEVIKIYDVLPAAYGANGITDEKNVTVFCEADGCFLPCTSPNEEITPCLFTKEEVKEKMRSGEFASRTQLFCYCWANRQFFS